MHPKLLGRTLIALPAILFFTQNASAKSMSHFDLMVTAGDSISAGFIANTRAIADESGENEESPTEVIPAPLGINYNGHAIPDWKLKLAQLLNRKDFSWSSGTQIDSHFLRLKKHLALSEPEVTLEVANVAMAGALTSDLTLESRDILKLWNSGKYQNIRYLTFLIGVNDVCADWLPDGIPDDEYARNIKNFFKALSVIQQPQPIRVLISSLPNAPAVGQESIMRFPLKSEHSCAQKVLQTDHYCNKLVYWKTPTEYLAKVALFEKKNLLLKQLTQELALQFPMFEFVYSESLFHQPIQIQLQAKDCFHPNPDGQAHLSNELWKDQPWW